MACPNDPDCSNDCSRPEHESQRPRPARVCVHGHIWCDRLFAGSPGLTPPVCRAAAERRAS